MAVSNLRPCDEMTVDDFIESWQFLLHEIRTLGNRRIDERASDLLKGPLWEMWNRVFDELLNEELLAELHAIVEENFDPEMLCRVISAIGAWDPNGPFGGLGGEGDGKFYAAQQIKEDIERWLQTNMSPHMSELFKALNQLLCMMRCL
ncbi:MAG: hypothetical protein J5I90_18015 [Caldilineales bacterium]|nr:hypothetical protein [Caldilineales bacterium]